MRKRLLVTLISLVCSVSFFSTKAQKADTIKLYFNIGVAELSETSVRTIDSCIYYEILSKGKKLGIIGYADYLGSPESNITLSETRANNVKEYLQSMGINEKDIQLVIGKGEVERNLSGAGGFAYDRRVDIIPGGFETQTPKAAKSKAPMLDLSNTKKDATIRLDNIYFFPGSHKVREQSLPGLQKLLNTMYHNTTLAIQIEGHICCLRLGNSDGYDYDSEDFHLSENRAKAVYDYLLQNRIKPERLTYKGFGITRPMVMPEKNETDENLNRRVEIRILSK